MEYLELIEGLKSLGLSETTILIIGVLGYFYKKHKDCEADRDKLRDKLKSQDDKLQSQEKKIDSLEELRDQLLAFKKKPCCSKRDEE